MGLANSTRASAEYWFNSHKTFWKDNNLEHIQDTLKIIGLGLSDQEEIKQLYSTILKSIRIGLSRQGPPTMEDGGLFAIRTGIPYIKERIWTKISPGTAAIVCAFGGTNWKICLAEKKPDGAVVIEEIQSTRMKAATYPFNEFASMMAQQIYEACGKKNIRGIKNVGISYGFPHENISTPASVDAKLVPGQLPKEWGISNDGTPQPWLLGDAILKSLQGTVIESMEDTSVVVINDTCAVALDMNPMQSQEYKDAAFLPIGLVGGTGTNACVEFDNQLINLELGKAPYLDNPIIDKMRQSGYASWDRVIIEFYSGGAYFPIRLGCGITMLGEQGAFNNGQAVGAAILGKDGGFVSRLANGEVTQNDLQSELQISINDEDFTRLRGLSRVVMYQAAQAIGLMLASVADVSRQGKGISEMDVALAEGSVVHNPTVKQIAEATCRQVGQPLRIAPADGLRGIGALAMSLPYIRAEG